MKHVKLFENFSLKVLPPVDISRPGEVVVAFPGEETFCVTLISESEWPMLQSKIQLDPRFSNPAFSQEQNDGYWVTQKPGIAYVYYTGMTKGDHDCEFEGPEFESKTPYMQYWITGNKNIVNYGNPHILQNWQQELDGENWDGVFVLKRGKVLVMAQGGYEPYCYEYSLDEYFEERDY